MCLTSTAVPEPSVFSCTTGGIRHRGRIRRCRGERCTNKRQPERDHERRFHRRRSEGRNQSVHGIIDRSDRCSGNRSARASHHREVNQALLKLAPKRIVLHQLQSDHPGTGHPYCRIATGSRAFSRSICFRIPVTWKRRVVGTSRLIRPVRGGAAKTELHVDHSGEEKAPIWCTDAKHDRRLVKDRQHARDKLHCKAA